MACGSRYAAALASVSGVVHTASRLVERTTTEPVRDFCQASFGPTPKVIDAKR
eukprot:COSAG06_NODE_771_length_12436_cov_39.378648_4_plen_53_part_00